jgi:hypothetical protein
LSVEDRWKVLHYIKDLAGIAEDVEAMQGASEEETMN